MTNTILTITLRRNLFAVVPAGVRFPEGNGRACLLLGRSPDEVAALMGFRPDGTIGESAHGFATDGGVGEDARHTALVHLGPAPADSAAIPATVKPRARAVNRAVARAFDTCLAMFAGTASGPAPAPCRTRRARTVRAAAPAVPAAA